MNTPLVDSHCHLDLYADYERVFAAARNSAAEFLAVTTTPLAWEQNRQLAAGSANIQVGLGLHPQLVGQPVADVAAFARAIEASRFVGEVGLDAGPRHYKTFNEQRTVFAEILRLCARFPGKVLSIHCVRAFKEIFALLDEHWSPPCGTLIFHWFSGTCADARRATERGCFFSINPLMANKDSAHRLLVEIPLDRLLTETDGPFTENVSQAPRQPGDVQSALELIASAKDLS
ncbi:MAG: TatD family hydrolase, partial [Rhodospirillales bacterium]|nr:TatD family hydrolase [Acetobacter sp.]